MAKIISKYIDKYIWLDDTNGCIGYRVFICRKNLNIQERFDTLEKAQEYRDEIVKGFEAKRIQDIKIKLNLHDYPINLIEKLEFDPECYNTFEERLQQLIDEGFLNDREVFCLFSAFRDNLTLEQIGKELGVTRERVRQIISRTLRRLKFRHRHFIYGEYANLQLKAKQEYEEYKKTLIDKWTYESALEFIENYKNTNQHTETTIDELDFSIRTYNCLKRGGINTIMELTSQSEEDLMKLRNLGRKSFKEIIRVLGEKGLELRND